MTIDEEITLINETAKKIVQLTNKPEPGLVMWCVAVAELMKKLGDIQKGTFKHESRTTPTV